MKKLCIVLVLIFSLVVLLPTFSFGAVKILETASDKYNVNGKALKLSSVSVTVDGKKMLAYKDILVSLGVKNDSKHLIWNAKQKSLTIVKEPTNVVLKVGSTSATVNKKVVKMEIAPVSYKNTMYISVKDIAGIFGNKFAFDSSMDMVFVRETTSFNATKAIISDAVKAMNSVEKYKASLSGDLVITVAGQKIISKSTIVGAADNKNKVLVSKLENIVTAQGNDQITSMDVDAANNTSYVKIAPSDVWQKQPVEEKEFNKTFVFEDIEASDINCAGFDVSTGLNKDEIILKGNLNLKKVYEALMSLNGFQNYTFKQIYSEVTINKNTNIISKIYLKADANTTDIPGGAKFTLETTQVYDNINGSFDVVLPTGIDG